REAFADRGFDGASIRAIATAAGVDPALVHHYFGTKEQLFLDTVGVPVNPGDVIPQVIEGDRDQIGARLVAMFLRVWGDPHSGPVLLAIVRSGLAHDWSARMLREFLTTQILRRVVAKLDMPPEEAPMRASLAASQMIGLGLARFVLRIEPLASADPETVVAI